MPAFQVQANRMNKKKKRLGNSGAYAVPEANEEGVSSKI